MVQSNVKNRADFHLHVAERIGDLINEQQDCLSILKAVAHELTTLLKYDVVSFYLHDKATDELVMVASHGLTTDPDKPVRLHVNEGLTGLAFRDRRLISEMPASEHPSFKHVPGINEERYESYVGVPLQAHHHCLGVLVAQMERRHHITPAEQILVHLVASRMASIMEVANWLDQLPIAQVTGEELDSSPKVSTQHTKYRKSRIHQGRGVSNGFASGPAFVYRGLSASVQSMNVEADQIAGEAIRLNEAFAKAEAEIDELIQSLQGEGIFSDNELAIFRAHITILNDSHFRNTIIRCIQDDLKRAESAVVEGVEFLARQFENHTERFLRDRAQDLRDIGEKVLRHLVDAEHPMRQLESLEEGAILVAREVGPSVLALLAKAGIGGVVTEKGGETNSSHTAILSQSLGIPAVTGVDHLFERIEPGHTLLVDGTSGFVYPNPSEELSREYIRVQELIARIREDIVAEIAANEHPEVRVHLAANIGIPQDATHAEQMQLECVGLYRTEFTFMQVDHWPSAAEQTAIYTETARHFPGYMTIRTLDSGADKRLPYADYPEEENPLLGLRSIRFSMEHLDLFREQLRAIVMTCQRGYQCRILLPMITHIWQFETARELLDEVIAELELPDFQRPPLGVMVEVPALIPMLPEYCKIADFFAIGTNDLTQYLIAVDRGSDVVGHLYSGLHPSMIRMLHTIHESVKDSDCDLSVCGELAGTPTGALALIALGYRKLSLAAIHANEIRYLANRLTTSMLGDVKDKLLTIDNEIDIHRYLDDSIEQIAPALYELDSAITSSSIPVY